MSNIRGNSGSHQVRRRELPRRIEKQRPGQLLGNSTPSAIIGLSKVAGMTTLKTHKSHPTLCTGMQGHMVVQHLRVYRTRIHGDWRVIYAVARRRGARRIRLPAARAQWSP